MTGLLNLFVKIVFVSQVMAANSTSETLLKDDNGFAKPVWDGKTFQNPPSFNNWAGLPGPYSMLKWKLFEKNHENVPSDPDVLSETIPVHNLTRFEPTNPKSSLFATWLGHATVLLKLDGATIITDPIWAEVASFTSLVGAKRYRPPPMRIEDLPEVDFAVISHDHYDHLDANAVLKITRLNPSIRWFVPLEMKSWMKKIGISNSEENPNLVTEMNWGENIQVEKNGSNFTIWCLPAQHWGMRGPFDKNSRLWAGWAVVGPNKRFYYSGDTGFCDKEFKKIGEKLGPFDLAAIPIGAYEPNWIMKSQHINPLEAVGIHELIKSKTSIGIHWGTYHMGSYEYYLEPRDKIKEIMESREDLKSTKFITIEMGKIWEEL